MRILRDGRIEVGFSEDGRLTALFEEGNQNKTSVLLRMLHWLAIIKNSAEEVTYVGYGIVDLAGFTGTT